MYWEYSSAILLKRTQPVLLCANSTKLGEKNQVGFPRGLQTVHFATLYTVSGRKCFLRERFFDQLRPLTSLQKGRQAKPNQEPKPG